MIHESTRTPTADVHSDTPVHLLAMLFPTLSDAACTLLLDAIDQTFSLLVLLAHPARSTSFTFYAPYKLLSYLLTYLLTYLLLGLLAH